MRNAPIEAEAPTFFDFLMRSVISPSQWKPGPMPLRGAFREQALRTWYKNLL